MSAERPTICRLEASDRDRWDKFVRQADGGTFYHLSGWKNLLESIHRLETYYLYCEHEGEIAGILPLARVKSWLFGDALISTPYLVYGGPVVASAVAAEVLLEAARDLACELNVDYLELRNRTPLYGDWNVKDTHVTFRKAIDPDSEANLLAIPRKQRAMVRKGIKAGLVAETDQDASRLYRTLLECKRNLGTPFFGRKWLEGIKSEFAESAKIITITQDGESVCSVMSFLFRDEVLPYYGGGGELARVTKGNDFMYWAVMEDARKNGFSVFDYGRSSIGSGAYHFKKHWGFEPEPLHYQYFLVKSTELPDVSPANPRYELLVGAWKRLPLWLAGLIGPFLARRLA